MKLVKAMFVADRFKVRDRITGTITVPQGSRVVHCGADPASRGNLAAWVEAPSIVLPGTVSIPFVILKDGDEVPDGCKFRGMLLAAPMLLVYECPIPGGEEQHA